MNWLFNYQIKKKSHLKTIVGENVSLVAMYKIKTILVWQENHKKGNYITERSSINPYNHAKTSLLFSKLYIFILKKKQH